MYKELYESLLAGMQGVVGRTAVGAVNCDGYIGECGICSLAGISASTLSMNGVTKLDRAFFGQATPALTEAWFNGVTTTGQYPFWTCSALRIVHLDGLQSFHAETLRVQSSAMTDVYIGGKTCDQILAMSGFPGMTPSSNSKYATITFHGSDGTIHYNGSAWIKS